MKTYTSAILRGIKAVDGRQMTRVYFGGSDSTHPKSVCILGALNLGTTGDAVICRYIERYAFISAFREAWGFAPEVLNDEGMSLDHLYGMAVAAGL